LILFPQDSKKKSRCQNYREDEEPVDAAEIRKILLNCNNRRLKSHLLVFGGRGTKAVELIAIRLRYRPFSKVL
jgi:hypothetical protein